MKKIIFLILLVFFLGISIPMISWAAGLVPCGTSNTGVCTLCHLISGIHRLIQWGAGILGILAIFALVVSGVIYLVSAGDSGMMETAKNFMKSAIIGTAVFLCAWLIINTTMYILGSGQNLGGVIEGNWFSFSLKCPANTSGDAPYEKDQWQVDTSGDAGYEIDQQPELPEFESPY